MKYIFNPLAPSWLTPVSGESETPKPENNGNPVLMRRRNVAFLSYNWGGNMPLNWNITDDSYSASSAESIAYFNPGANPSHLNILQNGIYYVEVNLEMVVPAGATQLVGLYENQLNTPGRCLITSYLSTQISGIGISVAVYVTSATPSDPVYITLYNPASTNYTIDYFSWFITKIGNAPT